MSKKQYMHHISIELDKINEQIDYKIMQRQSYQREARRHRQLLAQMARLRKGSFWSGLLGNLATMVF